MHHHLPGGDRELQRWLKDYGIEPTPRVGVRQQEAFAKLSKKSGRDRHELLEEAVDGLIDKYRWKASAPKR